MCWQFNMSHSRLNKLPVSLQCESHTDSLTWTRPSNICASLWTWHTSELNEKTAAAQEDIRRNQDISASGASILTILSYPMSVKLYGGDSTDSRVLSQTNTVVSCWSHSPLNFYFDLMNKHKQFKDLQRICPYKQPLFTNIAEPTKHPLCISQEMSLLPVMMVFPW